MKGNRSIQSRPIDVILVREITRIRIKTVDEKNSNAYSKCDVYARGVFSGTRTISRDTLLREYVTVSGKRINLLQLKNGMVYTVMRKCNIQAKAIIIKSIGKIKYCVNFDGKYCNGVVKTISSEYFKKMFIIQMQPSLTNGIRAMFNSNTTEVCDTPAVSNNETVSSVDNVKMKENKTFRQGNKDVKDSDKTGIKVSGRLFNINGKQVGFVIEDSKGNSKQISYSTAKVLVEKHKIDNMEIVTNNGKWFFRGNGMSLESLPKYIL